MRQSPLQRRAPLKRGGRLKPGRGFAASKAQREKVRGLPCLNCGGYPSTPAHLAARAQGGCDSADCVTPLCLACHRAFDIGLIDILPALEPGYRAEIAHCVEHLGLASAFRRLTRSRETL